MQYLIQYHQVLYAKYTYFMLFITKIQFLHRSFHISFICFILFNNVCEVTEVPKSGTKVSMCYSMCVHHYVLFQVHTLQAGIQVLRQHIPDIPRFFNNIHLICPQIRCCSENTLDTLPHWHLSKSRPIRNSPLCHEIHLLGSHQPGGILHPIYPSLVVFKMLLLITAPLAQLVLCFNIADQESFDIENSETLFFVSYILFLSLLYFIFLYMLHVPEPQNYIC